ncbi:hypothetical protein [Blastococcus sp. CCUG 61487]|uniref:hypothetical protein n=1 Tax=Blastococcus sp. CCUG 61487 TaxID=1840703 RepID=UPI0010C115A4|nr:hypothetical protein [Blastococcus sp. CCUG 61487]TKJ25215.1 hypothetical protein A6V29_04120 [Blastococcus sp. CCUG 61487]
MAAAQVVDLRVNPDDREQWVTLHGNGRIDSHNCPPVTDGPDGWFTRLDQPVAVAIHVYDWTEMKGYVLDKQGGVHAFGGADLLSLGGEGGNQLAGVPYWFEGIYRDWSWDTFNQGRGYVLDGYGTIHAFGGAPANVWRPGNRWSYLIARKLVVSWGPDVIRAYTLDGFGGIHADFSAVPVPVSAGAPYRRDWDFARDLAITDWVSPAGYTLDLFGWPIPWGGAEPSTPIAYNNSGDWARRMAILSPDDPLEFLCVWSFGQEYRWFASTPPTVVAGGLSPQSPASTVETTTRPMLAWAYSDAQKDSQAEVQLLVFDQAVIDGTPGLGTNPWAHRDKALVAETITNPTLRGIVSPVHLANGPKRMYVRARDTAGPVSWSTWSTRAWSQAVPLPATPTNLVATPSEDTLSVALSVSTSAGTANLVRFEFSDDYDPQDPDAATWVPVFDADAVPRAATTNAADWTIPFGPARRYRARVYGLDPAVISEPSNIAEAALSTRTIALTSIADPSLGGEVIAVGEWGWSEPTGGGLFQTAGDRFPTLLVDSEPKARTQDLVLDLNGRGEFEKVRALKRSNSVLLLRDPFGEAVYCRIFGSINYAQQREEPLPGEDTPLRHSHEVVLPLVEVAPPMAPDGS